MTIATPELDKMKKHRAETQAVSDFIDWLSEQDIELAHRPTNETYLRSVMESKDSLLARWKNINLREAENERVAILRDFQERQELS